MNGATDKLKTCRHGESKRVGAVRVSAGRIPLLALRAWMESGPFEELCAEHCLKLEPNVIPPGGLESAGIVLGHCA